MSILDPKYTFVHDGHKFKNPDDWSLRRVTRRGFDRLDDAGRKYRLVVNRDESGPLRQELDALQRTRTVLSRADVGDDVRVRAFDLATGEFVDTVRFFKTAAKLPVADTPGVPGIDRVCGLLSLKWGTPPSFRYAGICVCKPDSDHRDCAAVDWFDTLDRMREQRNFFLRPEVRDHVQLKYLILEDRIYGYWNEYRGDPYGGIFHSHIHVSVFGGIPGSAC